ncbi:plasmid replication initiator TrfA [Collimonas sp. H4R21]|uniref:Plasmid replication initiator TrfA n=1 Tax=Collimonas rhizosphaerae TaxID=3126357 RepID=A0ABU9PWU3_9BURK
MDHRELRRTLDSGTDILSKVAQLAKRATARTLERRQSVAEVSKATIQLSIWPESTRGVPNGVLRSALFGAIRKGPRRYVEREQVHSLEGIRIIYTGARLDQGDLDVWETVLHVARLQALGNECCVTAYQLLKLLGKTDTGKNRSTLDHRLSRMKATGVDVQIGRYGYEGSLIDVVYRDIETRKYIIQLNPKLRALFEKDQWTAVDWNVRHELDGRPLAQWLHGFFASHAKPFPYTVKKLHALCGSENPDTHGFKRDVRKALDAVSAASTKHGQLFIADIRDDLVYVKKTPSNSQRRHLVKKAMNQINGRI